VVAIGSNETLHAYIVSYSGSVPHGIIMCH
jgi:hypothetical protein